VSAYGLLLLLILLLLLLLERTVPPPQQVRFGLIDSAVIEGIGESVKGGSNTEARRDMAGELNTWNNSHWNDRKRLLDPIEH